MFRFRTATNPTGSQAMVPGRSPEVTCPTGTPGTYQVPELMKASIHHGRWMFTRHQSKEMETLGVSTWAVGRISWMRWLTTARSSNCMVRNCAATAPCRFSPGSGPSSSRRAMGTRARLADAIGFIATRPRVGPGSVGAGDGSAGATTAGAAIALTNCDRFCSTSGSSRSLFTSTSGLGRSRSNGWGGGWLGGGGWLDPSMWKVWFVQACVAAESYQFSGWAIDGLKPIGRPDNDVRTSLFHSRTAAALTALKESM